MPKMDGYQFLRVYRKERQTPIIIITAREEETDAVLGLDLGADDYVVKPFRMRELFAAFKRLYAGRIRLPASSTAPGRRNCFRRAESHRQSER